MKDNLDILFKVNNALGYVNCDDCMCSDCALYYEATCIADLIEDAYEYILNDITINNLLKKYKIILKTKEDENE